MGTPMKAPPLEGLKVLDLSWVFATPVGVRYLADYGATVVHVETTTRVDAMRNGPPWWQGEVGADRAGQFANVQTNKLALTANLATPEGRDLVRRLVGLGGCRRGGVLPEGDAGLGPGLRRAASDQSGGGSC